MSNRTSRSLNRFLFNPAFIETLQVAQPAVAITAAPTKASSAAPATPDTPAEKDDFFLVSPDAEFSEMASIDGLSTNLDGIDDFVMIQPSDFIFPVNFGFDNDSAFAKLFDNLIPTTAPIKPANTWSDGVSVW